MPLGYCLTIYFKKILTLLRYKFSGLDFIDPLTKYPHEPIHYLKPTQIFLIYITHIFSILLGLYKYSIPMPINCHGPFHKYYLLYPTYHPNSPQNMLIISLLKLCHKLHYPHTKPNIIWLMGKTQRKPKIQKSHYDVANSKVPL